MSSISSATLGNMVGNTASNAQKASETYSQFLLLLTTQLQHQDPLDPMESNEFTNQLVQFSQVEQGILTNEKLDAMLMQTSNNQIGQSLSYIGKDVYYRGNSVYYEGQDLKIGYAIDGEAKTAKLHVVDEDGQTIRSIEIPPNTTSGNVTWDGKDDMGNVVEKGLYMVRVDALSTTNEPIQDTYTGVPAHVIGVETIDGVLYLALNGDRRIDATSALSVSNPVTPPPAPPAPEPEETPGTGEGTGTDDGEGDSESEDTTGT